MKMIQNLAKLKIIMKNSMMSPEIVCQLQHSAKFLIDIDNLESESDDDDEEVQSSSMFSDAISITQG